MSPSIRRFFTILGIFITTAANVSAQTDGITVAWDPNDPDELVTEYRLYYKTGAFGPPYDGTGLNQGESPIIIPVADLVDKAGDDLAVLLRGDAGRQGIFHGPAGRRVEERLGLVDAAQDPQQVLAAVGREVLGAMGRRSTSAAKAASRRRGWSG